MKVLVSLLAGAAALTLAGTAAADSQVNWNVGVASDYVDRGVNKTTGDAPSLSGGAELSSGGVYGAYAGVQGRTVNSRHWDGAETDVYAGYRTSLGPVALDGGVVYNAVSDGRDYYELQVGAAYSPTSRTVVGGQLVYSPNEVGPNEGSRYAEVNGAYYVTDKWSISAAAGRQEFDDGAVLDDYNTYNVGVGYRVTKTVAADLRYHANDLDSTRFGELADPTVTLSLRAGF